MLVVSASASLALNRNSVHQEIKLAAFGAFGAFGFGNSLSDFANTVAAVGWVLRFMNTLMLIRIEDSCFRTCRGASASQTESLTSPRAAMGLTASGQLLKSA